MKLLYTYPPGNDHMSHQTAFQESHRFKSAEKTVGDRYSYHASWCMYGIFSSSWLVTFPTIGVLQNGWFIMENPIKMHDLRVLFFFETPKCRYACYLHVSSQVAWLLIHVTRKAVGFFVRAKVWWARHLPTNSRSRGRRRMIEADAKRLVIHPGRWTAGTYKSPI